MRTRHRGLGFVLLALVSSLALWLSARPAAADVFDEAWKKGNDAYFRRNYEEARAAYEQIERQGVLSADLYYNLGATYFRLGHFGRAAWAFERALALDPDEADARFNLSQVHKLLARRARDRIEGEQREPLWIRIVTLLSPSTQAWLFIALYLVTFGLLFQRLRVAPEERAPWSAGVALTGAATLLAGLLLLGRVALDRIPFGIVLPEAVAVKEGADTNYRTSFEVHAGLKVRLLESEQGWARIRLPNGLEGWVREQDVGRL